MILAGADENVEPLVRQSGKPEFGDYQANGAMGAAKKLGMNPRDFAQKILANVNLDGVAEKLEIAGPGFINIFLNKNWRMQILRCKRSIWVFKLQLRKRS